MKIKIFLCVNMLMLSLNACAIAPTAYLSVNIVDEMHKPVEGVTIKGGFTTQKLSYIPGPDTQGVTDSEGRVNISGPAYFNVWVTAKKDGYYLSEKNIAVNQKKDQEIYLVIRRKHHPIAMYAKKITLKFPERMREFGVDLFKGDFVLAGHAGVHGDVEFKFYKSHLEQNNSTQVMSIRFPNPDDGILKMHLHEEWKFSKFKSDYYAPATGYVNSIEITDKNIISNNKYIGHTPFYMRIRASKNEKGKINKAYYCKIWPGIELLGARLKKPLLKMTYYCNPTLNDKNMEFDPEHNLFRHLNYKEYVSEP